MCQIVSSRDNSLSSLSLLLLLLLSSLLMVFSSSSATVVPMIESYARVSTNRGQSIIKKNFTEPKTFDQSRNFQDTKVSRSPIYAPATITKLQNGEAIDHRKIVKYTTLDRDTSDQLGRQDVSGVKAQERFHPPASFEHNAAHSNAMRTKFESMGMKDSNDDKSPIFPVPSYATLPRDVYTTSYDYSSGKPSSNDDRPAAEGNYYSINTNDDDSFSKIPDSYAQPNVYGDDNSGDFTKFSGFPTSSTHDEKHQSKFPIFHDTHEPSSYGDSPYVSHHDLFYDHPPEEYFHDHTTISTTTTTEEPEMNDQRLSKRPYSYYYIGKKLWYIPLYFSIYFIIYIAALVLKSIARHKINFPSSLAAVSSDARNFNVPHEAPGWYDLTKRVLDGIDLYNSIGKSKKS